MKRTSGNLVVGRTARFLADAASSAPEASGAESEAKRLFCVDPARPEPMYLLGLAAGLRGDRLAAQRFYRAALALDSTFEPARERLRRSVRREDDELGERLLGARNVRSPDGDPRLSRSDSAR